MPGSSPEAVRNISDQLGRGRFLLLQTDAHLFVSQWPTSGVYGLMAAMLTTIILAVTYECLAEYLRFLRNRALTRKTGPQCCGFPVVTCWEKLVQTLVHFLRVLIGYLTMLCVMTANVWLIVAAVVGAVVGFGVGKPLVANAIRDIVTSYDYRLATVTMTYGKKNTSQRSMSWRYRTNEMVDMDNARLREEIELLSKEADPNKDDVFGNGDLNAGADIVWIRRSAMELDRIENDEAPVVNDETDDVQLRHSDNKINKNKNNKEAQETDNYDTLDSVKTDDSSHSRTSRGRFRSTSKLINESFRSNSSDQYRQSLSRQSGFHHSLDRPDNRISSATASKPSPMESSPGRSNRRTGVNRSASTASYAGGSSPKVRRFKPISRQISREFTSFS